MEDVLDPEAINEVLECLDESDMADFEQYVRQQRKKEKPKDESAGVPNVDPPAPKPRFPMESAAGAYTVQEVRALLPSRGSLKVSRETRWHTRWRARFEGTAPPNTRSIMYGGAISEAEAVHRLAQWAWAVEQRLGGEPCPFEGLLE